MRILLVVLCGCAGEPAAVVCGTPDGHWYANAREYRDCTHFLGSVHVNDSVEEDLRWLPDLRVVDGAFTLFRNDGTTSLRGLESLETVGGTFAITHHARLADLEGLANLSVVGGGFTVMLNPTLHDAEARALVAGIAVAGTVEISRNAER